MDLKMPDMDGATATRLIRQQYPQVQVIALTSYKEEGLVQTRCRRGRSAICSKMCRPMNWPGLSGQRIPGGPPFLRRLLRRWCMQPTSRPRQATI